MKKTFALLFVVTVATVAVIVVFKTDYFHTSEHREPVSNITPNIVFIMTDDQALSDLEYMPNVQKYLVQEGKTFSNYFDNYAVCCVARASILRGQNANNTGIKGNSAPAGGYNVFHEKGVDGEQETIAVWLQNEGYTTAYMGKYLNGYGNDDPLFVPPGWDEWFGFSNNTQALFDYEVNHNGVTKKFADTEKDFKTDVLSSEVVSFIQDQENSMKPFFIQLTPTSPHDPATPAARHEDLFKEAQVKRTPAFNEADVSDKPLFVRELPSLTENEIDQLDRRYKKRLQSLQAVDEMVKAVVTTLTETNQLDNTYIFFTSDNGYHLGQHRMEAGKRTAYEEDIHLPLVVRGPQITPGIVDDIVGNIDLAPTFGEIAGGIEIPYEPDGRSFAGFLSSQFTTPTQWRNGYLIGFELDDLIANNGIEVPRWLEKDTGKKDAVPKDEAELVGEDILKIGFAGVRTGEHVYVEYGNGDTEFYDLRADPYQLQNISKTAPQELIGAHQAILEALRTCSGKTCIAAEQMSIPE